MPRERLTAADCIRYRNKIALLDSQMHRLNELSMHCTKQRYNHLVLSRKKLREERDRLRSLLYDFAVQTGTLDAFLESEAS